VARGIGGEDGPSLWMFVAVLCVWPVVKNFMSETKKDVTDTLGIGHNTAGPLQSQTSADIQAAEDTVKSWTVSWSTLKPKTYYQNIADRLWAEMNSQFNIDEQALIDACKPLSKMELMAVAKCFGVKENTTVFGLTTWSGHIFQAFDIAFDGMFKKNELAQMKKIWSVTKQW
jgi:hypothetical protein